MKLDRIPMLLPEATTLPCGFRPPSLGRGDKILIVRYQHLRVLRGAKRTDPDLVRVCLTPGNHLVHRRLRTARTHRRNQEQPPQPHRRSTGSLEKELVEEHDQTIVLRPFLERKARVVFHAWFDNIPGDKHLNPLSWNHASGPETGARVLLTMQKVLGLVDVVVRESMCFWARPDLVDSIVADCLASDTARPARHVGEPRHPSLRPASPEAAVSSAPYMAWFSKNANAA